MDSIQHPELQDVRLLLDTGQVVIYNYHLDLWFLSADRNIASLEVRNGKMLYLDKQGNIHAPKDKAKDFKFQTGWITLDRVTGYKRLRKLTLAGDLENIDFIRCEVAFDFKENYENLIPADLGSIDANKDFFDVKTAKKRIDFFPTRQKCGSF